MTGCMAEGQRLGWDLLSEVFGSFLHRFFSRNFIFRVIIFSGGSRGCEYVYNLLCPLYLGVCAKFPRIYCYLAI